MQGTHNHNPECHLWVSNTCESPVLSGVSILLVCVRISFSALL
jgi:hypothetical protein